MTADETFGPTIGEGLVEAEACLRRNPRSKALARVPGLCAAVANGEPEAVGGLRYQPLQATAAALIGAREDGADRVAFVRALGGGGVDACGWWAARGAVLCAGGCAGARWRGAVA